MHGALLAALFDGDKGAFFSVVLIGLLVAGAAVLIINLAARSRPPPAPKWEAVPDEEDPTPVPPTPSSKLPKAAPRRRA